jgi:hypothetical protein
MNEDFGRKLRALDSQAKHQADNELADMRWWFALDSNMSVNVRFSWTWRDDEGALVQSHAEESPQQFRRRLPAAKQTRLLPKRRYTVRQGWRAAGIQRMGEGCRAHPRLAANREACCRTTPYFGKWKSRRLGLAFGSIFTFSFDL